MESRTTHFPSRSRSRDVTNLELPGFVWYGSKSGFATLLVSEQFCTLKRSWNFEERCAAILFGTTLVMAAYAQVKVQRCMMPLSRASSKVLREGRRCGAKDFNIIRDLTVELGMMCPDEKDIEELSEMYGPLCWQGYDKDPGGFKKVMWSVEL